MKHNNSSILLPIYILILSSISNIHAQEDRIGKLVVEELRGNVNTEFQEFSPSLSPNGNSLYFYSKRDGRAYTDIFISKKKPDGTWDFPQEVKELNSEYDDQSPFLSSDGKQMFLSSNRDGSIESRLPNGKIAVSRDIYLSELKGGSWCMPVLLPREVNSDMIEENPHYNNGVLLFTRYPFSKPEQAKIYMSHKTKNGWSQAKILPQPINDLNTTIAAAFSDDAKTLFFASNRPGGMGGFDLYSIEWSNGSPVGKVENLGSDFNTEGDEAYFSYHRPSKTILFARREAKKSYNLYSASIPRSIETQLEEDSIISLDTIYFDKSSYDLLSDSKVPLDQIVTYLKKNPKVKMKIIGHTDLNGNFQDNIILSQNRAKSVAAYLIGNGIIKERLQTEGKGSKEPIFEAKDDEASKRNRRTEFKVILE